MVVINRFVNILEICLPKVGIWGGLLTFEMSVVTHSFLIITPEVYVPNLGGDMPMPKHDFP